MLEKRVVGVFSLCLLLVLASGLVLANELEEEVKIFYDADINVNLEGEYDAGEVINGIINVDNREDFPIADAYLIIEVLKGCEEPIYPSQFSDCDNIFEEIVIDEINVPATSNIEVPFSYVLPENLAAGEYRMDFAFRTKKTPIVSMPHILLSHKYQPFIVSGPGTFPYAKILRTKTNINNETGPIGVGIAPGEDFVLDVYVESDTEGSASLKVQICDWQDSICDVISTKTENVNLQVGENLIPVALTTPTSPDAYSIRIELNDANGLVSLYRSRVVALGTMAKVRKLYTDSYYYNKEDMEVSVLVAGSPDHYTRPVVENIFLKVTVTDLVGDKVVGEKTKVIGDLDAENLFAEAKFEIDVSDRLFEFETCAELTNSQTNEVYERYCYITDANKFPSLVHDIKLKKLISDGVFDGDVCIYNIITGHLTDSELFVSVKDGETIIAQKREIVDGCLDLTFGFEESKRYDILVQDMTTNQDFEFELFENPILLGVSRDYWVYSIFTGVAILLLSIILIAIFAKKKRRSHR